MIILFIGILTFCFAFYIGMIETRFGNKLDSISKSFYLLQDYKEGGWFRAFCLVLACFMIAMGGIYDQGLFFASGAGALFVGAATTYYDRITKGVHFAGAGSLIFFAGLGLAFEGVWWVLMALAGGLALTFIFNKKILRPVYFYELYAFLIIIIGFLTII